MSEEKAIAFEPVVTGDGTPTFWSGRWSEHYHSREGALSESFAKFVGPSRVASRLAAGDVALLDICFGMGYNALAACAEAERVGVGTVYVRGLEVDRDVVRAAAGQLRGATLPLAGWGDMLLELAETGCCKGGHFVIEMTWGDARHALAPTDGPFDVVFHDPFSSQRCAELWTVDFFVLLRRHMAATGELYTYSEALAVRSGLLAAGFCVGQSAPADGHRGGTVAATMARVLQDPLPVRLFERACAERRGEPYRDPHLSWSNSEVLADRERRMRSRCLHRP